MAGFNVTTTTTSAKLDGAGRAQVVFSVTNTAHRNLTARGSAMVKDATQAAWITVTPAEAPSPVDSTQEMTAQVAIPKGTAPGTYLFGLRVVGVENTDEFTGESPWVSVEVAQPVAKQFPWVYALIGVVAVVLIGVVGFVAFKVLSKPSPGKVAVTATLTDFGTVAVGQAGKISVVTLKNIGTGDSVVKLSVGGDQANDFPAALGSCQNASIKAGESCQFELAFQPTAQGQRKAQLLVAATSGQTTLDVTGVGQGMGQLSFQPNNPNLSGNPATVTVTNTGSGPFTIVQMSVTDTTDFHISPGSNFCLNATLPVGGKCTFVVSTTISGKGGLRTDAVVFLGNSGSSSSVQSMPISGGSLIVCLACRVQTLAPVQHF
jgi:hypothetical protein